MAQHRSTGVAPSSQNSPAAPSAKFARRAIYFIGIGGCGMSGLAKMLHQRGAICSGSDYVPSALIDDLEHRGVRVSLDQFAGNLPDQCDMVIASAAIKPDHPELLAAQNRGIPVISYAEALGLAQTERTGVSIAGTHGKSTTTAMLAHVLIHTKLDPSFIVGATCPQIGGGSRTGSPAIPLGKLKGKPGILIAEACEFNRSFHHHNPTIALINNIEEDHLDIYGTLDAVIQAFAEFAQLLPSSAEGGRLLIAHEGAHRLQVTTGLTCKVETFGFHPEADYHVIYDPVVQRVGILQDGIWLAQWTNRMPGAHNALNSAAAGILANFLGADWADIADALASFAGLDRRMQRLGTKRVHDGEVTVYDDYGHHPTEIEKTLKALRAAECPKRLICVFQPHQHSRTRFLLEQFAQSFSVCDEVI
ncbi:MAG TPA: UDP-N-acetylmuramate--L-alanine ligase, partial [Phycisphaerales bacterium]|nr:UDP-N-acetylmuramate--L-alanine ligase [Phycisphaerales bacterium]